ncbi:MAG TPA: TIGR03545 family protein, partial [bacterium]|nr:TIGR03545 family protein [bacterium]
MIRWKGLIFLVIVFCLALTVVLIFKDSWLERRIEQAGSAVVGARVDIDDLDFSLTGLHMRWNRLQVTDPRNTMQNLFETGRCEFNMETWPLLSGKVVIENLEMSDLRTGTPREEDGKLPEPPQQEELSERGFLRRQAEQLSEQVSSNVSLNVAALSRQVNVDSVMNLLDLRSIHKIDSLQNDFERQYQAWDERLTTLNPVDELRDIESDLRSLSINQIETIPDLKEAISTAEQSRNRARELYTTLQSAGDSLVNDLKRIPDGIDRIDDWVRQDYQRAQALAQLPDISAQNISRFIFGDRIVNQFTKYIQYVGMAREYAGKLQSGKPEKKKPPRGRGQDIPFFSKNARPRFWIQHVSLSGTTGNQIPLEGSVRDIVSDQRFIGRTTVIDLASRKQDGIAFTLHGTLNYLENEPQEQFELQYANFSLKNANLSNSALLPNAVSEGVGAITSSLHLQGDSLNSTIRFQANQLQFAIAR